MIKTSLEKKHVQKTAAEQNVIKRKINVPRLFKTYHGEIMDTAMAADNFPVYVYALSFVCAFGLIGGWYILPVFIAAGVMYLTW